MARKRARGFFGNRDGATAIEYGAVAAVVVIAAVFGLQIAGVSFGQAFGSVLAGIRDAGGLGTGGDGAATGGPADAGGGKAGRSKGTQP